MKKRLWLAILLALGLASLIDMSSGQVVVGNYPVQTVAVAPSGSCAATAPLVMVQGTGALYTCQSGIWTAVTAGTGGGGFAPAVPAGLQYLGDGSDGAYTCTTTCSSNTGGEFWFSSFNVSAGATATFLGGQRYGTFIRVTGACTIAGTLSSNGANVFGLGNNYGGSGGGGGGGTAAGTVGTSGYAPSPGGTAGAAGGGVGGNGTLLPSVNQRRTLVTNSYTYSLWLNTSATGPGGAQGGAGGSGGGAGGGGGGLIALICGSINFTGTIDVGGAPGGASTGNNIGAGGGGGGGILIMRSSSLTNTGTINVAGGAGGSCGAFTGCGTGGAGGPGWSLIISN